jgi:hypothetical protein
MMHLAGKQKRLMATVTFNAITKGFTGSIGGLLFRQIHGKTIVTQKPRLPKKQSELQRANRVKFKNASYWAKVTVRDPEKKAYYARMAKKLKLPNAYTAAICDYMRKGIIKEIDTRQYKGKVGDIIRIKAQKKDFSVGTVKVTFQNADGEVIESGHAVRKHDFFVYQTCTTLAEKIPVKLTVSMPDHVMNVTTREVQVLL